jgi:hypothetical protein
MPKEERIFSMVQKHKTAFRASLDPKGTLSSILTVKLANDVPVIIIIGKTKKLGFCIVSILW